MEQRHYVQHDANFNITAITDPTGTVVERYLYDPYGQATVLAANWQPTTANHDWQYLHQGGRYDPATTLYHFRNRDYSPELGRWVQQDPKGYVDGMGLYNYVLGSPIMLRDSFGLQTARNIDPYKDMGALAPTPTQEENDRERHRNDVNAAAAGASVFIEEVTDRSIDEAKNPLNYAGGPLVFIKVIWPAPLNLIQLL